MNIQLKPSDPFDGRALRSHLSPFHTILMQMHVDVLLIVHSLSSVFFSAVFFSFVLEFNKTIKNNMSKKFNMHQSVGRSLSVSGEARGFPIGARARVYPINNWRVKVCAVLIMISHFSRFIYFFCRAQQLRVLNVQDKVEYCMATRSACAKCARCENLRVIDRITIGIIENGKELV